MGVGDPGEGVLLVPVVPDRHQPRITHRGERRRPGAHHDPGLTARHPEPLPVALGRPEVSGQGRHHVRPHQRGAGLPHPAQVAVVGDHQQGPSTGGRGGRGEFGETRGPVLPRHGLPDRARRAPPAHRLQERAPQGVAVPCLPRWRCGVGGRLPDRFPLHPGVTGRHRQPEQVVVRSGVAVGQRPGELRHLPVEHRFGGHHPLQPHQPCRGDLAALDPLQQETVEVLPGEPHADPDARCGVLVEVGRHEVVEGVVQVRVGQVDADPGDRQAFRRPPLTPSTRVPPCHTAGFTRPHRPGVPVVPPGATRGSGPVRPGWWSTAAGPGGDRRGRRRTGPEPPPRRTMPNPYL